MMLHLLKTRDPEEETNGKSYDWIVKALYAEVLRLRGRVGRLEGMMMVVIGLGIAILGVVIKNGG